MTMLPPSPLPFFAIFRAPLFSKLPRIGYESRPLPIPIIIICVVLPNPSYPPSQSPLPDTSRPFTTFSDSYHFDDNTQASSLICILPI
ncbi:hypothetical protein M413DRAFT_449750 [Hebeloma cylindrosporum]|uniref:Uncharacterized protein n=1 Tax=Hebeloma cylindrosporum TaxID=76867 RepID=A0A0C2Y2Y7_HEBCY|nr:hypothetical protein M413DRAFT_449750 [Hebeloma cylindrosporum h7]